jgi:hypothetical protein
MTRSEALAELRRRGELRMVRGHWCSRCTGKGHEYREVLPPAMGAELVRAGLAVVEGDRLRPA